MCENIEVSSSQLYSRKIFLNIYFKQTNNDKKMFPYFIISKGTSPAVGIPFCREKRCEKSLLLASLSLSCLSDKPILLSDSTEGLLLLLAGSGRKSFRAYKLNPLLLFIYFISITGAFWHNTCKT